MVRTDIVAGQRAECQGKIAYLSKADAVKVVKRKRQPLQIYRCRFCDFFHIGGSSSGHIGNGSK